MNLAILLLAAILHLAAGQEQQAVLVNYPQGTVQGFHVDYGSDNISSLFYGKADVFLGIPYVKPPVGELRFAKPVELCNLDGSSPYNATYERLECPQAESNGNTNFNAMSEDCLYLNVFTPNAQATTKYPVMFWIHGGSLMGGSAKQFPYKGAIRNLVSRGVVVVVIQYRLSMLGFFTSNDDTFPANLGILDQVEAMRWVQKYIFYFGGDPSRVTIFGQSAGACSVSAHTYSPLSRGLFQQAIVESGTVLTCFEGSLGFTNMSERRAAALCNTTNDQWLKHDLAATKSCLMAADWRDFLHFDNDLQDMEGWKMSQDNYFMPLVPRDLASERTNMPIMIGSTLNEWSGFDLVALGLGQLQLSTYGRQVFENNFRFFGNFLGDEKNPILSIMENVYAPPVIADNDSIAWLKVDDMVNTCNAFTGFINGEVDLWLANGNKQVYLYEYTHYSDVGRHPFQVPGWHPVPHAAEIPFVWSQESTWTKAIQDGSVTDVDSAVLNWFGTTWTNFAKFGNPTPDGSWTPVPERRVTNYLEIGDNVYTMRSNYRQIDNVIWNAVISALLGGPLPPDNRNRTGKATIQKMLNKLTDIVRADSICDVSTSSLAWTNQSPSTTSPNFVRPLSTSLSFVIVILSLLF